MKNLKYFLVMAILLISQTLYSHEKVKLTQDLSIGAESGDENYIFGRISDIAVSSKVEIFVLDSAKRKIQKFDNKGKFLFSVGGKGQGPGEFETEPIAIENDRDGNLIVTQFRKVSIFNESGNFVGSFRLDFQCQDLFIDDRNRIILMGLKDGKIFHIYNREGEEIFSFGSPLKVPEKYSKYKDFHVMKLPYKVYFTNNKRLIYLSPYKYELRIFDKENQLRKEISHKSEFYKPAEVMEFQRGISLMVMDYSVFEYKNFMYVCLMGKDESQIDIFKNDKYFNSIKIKSFPKAMDNEGKFYAIDDTGFPKVLRFSLIIE